MAILLFSSRFHPCTCLGMACLMYTLQVAILPQTVHAQPANFDIPQPMQDPKLGQAWGDASRAGDLKALKTLHEQGMQLDAADDAGWTALLVAINRNYKDVTDWLIENGAQLNVSTFYGYTTLMSACTQNNARIAQLAIDAGVPVDAQLNWNEGQHSAAHFAVANNARECFDLLVKNKANLHLTNSHRLTPLGWAVYWGHFDLYKHMFIDMGLSPAEYQGAGKPLMTMAMLHNRPDIMKPMAVMGLNTRTNAQEEDALEVALKHGYLECAKVILYVRRWREPHPWNQAETDVIQAIMDGNTEQMVSLIQKNAELFPLTFISIAKSFVDVRGNLDMASAFSKVSHPLQFHASYYEAMQKELCNAIQSEYLQLIEAYIKAGANLLDPAYIVQVNQAAASIHSNPKVLQLLIDHGFHFDMEGDRGPAAWALRSAVFKQNVEVARLLIQAGAYVFNDLIIDAIASKNKALVELLLAQNLNLHEPDFKYRGESVQILKFAQQQSTPEIFDLIQKAYIQQQDK